MCDLLYFPSSLLEWNARTNRTPQACSVQNFPIVSVDGMLEGLVLHVCVKVARHGRV